MIKKISIILFIIISLILSIGYVFAADTQVTLQGDTTVNAGESKTVTVKISSGDNIGVVSGKISHSSEIESIEVKGKNNWNLTYNSATGQFNLLKAEGAKEELIMDITYTTKKAEGTARITLSGIQVTTTEYTPTQISNDVVKEIKIKKAGSTTDDTNTNENVNNNTQEDANTNTGNNTSDNKDKNTNSGTSSTNKNTSNKKDNTIINTTSKRPKLPQTGVGKATLGIVIVLIISVSIVAYLKYKKYKEI